MGAELTTANKILVAASHLAEESETFTAEDLIVRAWKDYPESFGLSGYRENYPDSNRVLSKLMGSVGLCSRGWLEQVSTKLYRITPGGRKFAQALLDNTPSNDTDAQPTRVRTRTARAAAQREVSTVRDEESAPPARAAARTARTTEESPEPRRPTTPPRAPERVSTVAPKPVRAPEPVARPSAPPARPAPVPAPAATSSSVPASKFDGMATLQRLVTSVANQKFSRGAMVTFADACAYWAINASVNSGQLASRLIEVEALLKRAEGAIQSSGAPIRVNDRVDVTLTTVIGLQGLHRMLKQKYQRELDHIRARGD
jgi:hypothetical protein